MRQPHRVFNGLVQNAHFVVVLKRLYQPTHHDNPLLFGRFFDFYNLEAARQSSVLLEILLVLRPGGGSQRPQFATRQSRLQEVRRIVLACLAARANHGMGLINKENDRLSRSFHFIDHGLEPVFELTFDSRARLQQAQVQRADGHILQRFWNIAFGNAQEQSLRPLRFCRRPPRPS